MVTLAARPASRPRPDGRAGLGVDLALALVVAALAVALRLPALLDVPLITNETEEIALALISEAVAASPGPFILDVPDMHKKVRTWLERRGAVTPQTGQPAYYFNKAAEIDPDDPDYFFNLGYAHWLSRDTQAAIYWLREAVRRNPTDGDAHFVLGAALSVAGSQAEASREKELARRLSSTYEQWEKRPPAESVPKGLERLKSDVELPHASRIETTLASSGQRDQRELARFYLDRAQRMFEREADREAVAELNRALYLSPYEADAHLLLGRIHLRNGRLHAAIDALKISLWSEETPEAHVVLGEAYVLAKNPQAARAEAERALALDPGSADAKRLLERVQR